MKKKYLSLGIMVAIVVVWLIAPLFDALILEMNAFDLLGNLDMCGLPDFLMLLAPLAAVALGLIGMFKNAAMSKIGGYVGAGGMALSLLLNIAFNEGALEVLAWGFWALLILTVANFVVCFMPDEL